VLVFAAEMKRQRNEGLESAADAAGARAASQRLVSDALQLLPAFRHTELTAAGRRAAQAQAVSIVQAQDALLAHILDVRIVSIHRSNGGGDALTNHVNLRIAAPYATMLHHERARESSSADELLFCFMASEQLQPIVVLVVVHAKHGRLELLKPEHMPMLETAIQQFKTRFGLQNESYAYTCLTDRRAASSVHSKHFHLKIRIPTEMYLRVFPAVQTIGSNHACLRKVLEPLKQLWEPLAYGFQTQELMPWTIARLLMLADVDDGEYHP
jgi:diadenosine tetraphosphate (Ap4A) HIT family hydrolase